MYIKPLIDSEYRIFYSAAVELLESEHVDIF
jgi:hypothetical protein